MRVNQHLGLLDRYAGTSDLLTVYQADYQELRDVRRTLSRLRQSDQEAAQRQELLAYQVEEIQAAALDPGEEDHLLERRNRLANAEKLASLSQHVLTILEEAPPDQPTVMDLFGRVVESVEDLSHTDASLSSLEEETAEIFQGLSDISRRLRLYLDSLEFDPEELEKVMDRVELIRSLKKKYGESIPEILAYQAQARSELNEITDRGKKIDAYEKKELRLLEKLAQQGRALSEARRLGAEALTDSLEKQLGDLKMAGARFAVDFHREPDPQGVAYEEQRVAFYPDGLEKVEFLIETNPGEGLKPLVKVASGGETARLMLALKHVLAGADQINTLVFDEIDQGIGGRIGTVVGEKLYRLADDHQVFCITHLPQLAGFGDQHFQVFKTISGGRSVIQVREVSGEERLKELATMLGGISETTLDSARELMEIVAAVSRE
jgi:DNA repair protein RecN (Recombination protein N)